MGGPHFYHHFGSARLCVNISVSFCLTRPNFFFTMAPTKAKVRKTKEAATPASPVKRTRRAGNKRLGHATTVQDQHQIDAEEVAVTVQ